MALKRNPHEIEEMRERKKQKNRESAQRARDRFKAKMRWLEDQVRLIQERHDNLVRENTYMRHMHSAQTQKLDQLLKRENEAVAQEAAEQQAATLKRPHSSSDQDSDQDSGIRSPKQSKFSIGFLSQSSKTEEKKEASAAYPGLSNPTAIYGFLPHQLPKLNFQPMLSQPGAVPALRLSPGGTMHMESNASYEEDDEEVDVGSPVRSDSDHGIGSSEHNSTTDQSSDTGNQSE